MYMSRTHFFIFLFSFCFASSLFAQTEKDIKVALKNKDYSTAAKLYYTVATDKWKTNQKEATEYFLKGIKLAEDNDLATQAYEGYNQMAGLQLKDEDYSGAARSFEKALKYQSKVSIAVVQTELNLGKAYLLRGREKKSIGILEDAVSHALQLDDADLQKQAYLLLIRNYKALGDGSKVTEYEDRLELMSRDEEHESELNTMEEKVISAEERVSSVTEVLKSQEQTLVKVSDSLKEVKAISDEQQLKIDLLNVEKELSEVTLEAREAELQNNKLVRNSLIIGFILVLILAAVTYKGYKDKTKAGEEIEKKQKDIQSSINYGLRIQQAMLPSREKFEMHLPRSFVLFKPRDVVSGDFYWINELYNEKIAVAAVDCTGHGVPGAFMSMIGSNALDSIVNTYVDEPDKILNELHFKVFNALKQEETGNKDGMDMALCVIDMDRDQLHFAGAKNHLVYIKEGEVFQIRGDKHPIGGIRKVKSSYQQHTIDLEGEMYFYMYSDGFVDQFGGADNMKYMSKRFKQLLLEIHKKPMEEQKNKLEEAFLDWKGEGKQTDDVLVVGFRIDA